MTEIFTVYESEVPTGAQKLPTLNPPKEFLVECVDQSPMRGRAVDAAGAEAGYRACLGAIGEVTVREIVNDPPPQKQKTVKQLLSDADDVLADVAAIEVQTT